MAETELVSVILPVYNGEKYVCRAVQSILDQTYKNFEILIINDGSTDNSSALLSQHKDPRVRLLDNETNIGLIGTLNRGLSLASGEYIARMDQDDLSRSDRFERQIDFMRSHPDIGICGSWVTAVRSSGEALWPYPLSSEEIKCALVFRSAFAHPSVMLRRQLVVQHQLQYADGYPHAEDYELWVRCARLTEFANIPEPLIEYQLHGENTSDVYGAQQKKTIEKIHGLVLDAFQLEPHLDTHYDISCYSPIVDSSALDDIQLWLGNLLEANESLCILP